MYRPAAPGKRTGVCQGMLRRRNYPYIIAFIPAGNIEAN